MNTDAAAGRYEFGVRVDDPRQALDDLANTVPLVDDIIAVLERIELVGLGTEDFYVARRELVNLRHRIEAIHTRLST